MPAAKDPHVEAKEVADKATVAAVTGPNQADVAASEVFGEDSEEEPIKRIEKNEQAYHKRLTERVKKEKAEQQMHNLGEGLTEAAYLETYTRIAQIAFDNDESRLGKSLKEALQKIKYNDEQIRAGKMHYKNVLTTDYLDKILLKYLDEKSHRTDHFDYLKLAQNPDFLKLIEDYAYAKLDANKENKTRASGDHRLQLEHAENTLRDILHFLRQLRGKTYVKMAA